MSTLHALLASILALPEYREAACGRDNQVEPASNETYTATARNAIEPEYPFEPEGVAEESRRIVRYARQ